MRPAAPVPHVCRPAPARSRFGRWLERAFAPFLTPLVMLGALAAFVASKAWMPSPGTVITTATRPGPSQLLSAPGATLFIVGQAERGSVTEAIEVRSILGARAVLGPRVTYGVLDDQLATYFAEGGTRAYVARVVGPAATTGFLMLMDMAGAPVATLKVWAASPGAWSTRIKIQVTAGSLANTFAILVRFDDVLVETWDNLTSPANAEQVINHTDDNAGSSYIIVDDQDSVTAAPNNNAAVLASTALSAGADDRASIVTASYTAALARFTPGLGDGLVCIPGQTATNVEAGLRAHAEATNREVFVATASGQTVAQAKATAITLRGLGSFKEGVGLVFPWVYVPDGAGGRRLISPEGYAAGKRAVAHVNEGPWRAAAGEISKAEYVLAPELVLTEAEMVDLNAQHVIPVMDFGTEGVQLYGYRSLSTDERNYSLLTQRDVLNRLSVAIKKRTDRLVFRTVDGEGKFLSVLDTEIRAEVEPMASAGGLSPRVVNGDEIDPGWVIDTGPGVNTDVVLAANEAHADVAVRPSGSAETIRVTIAKVAIGTAI